MVFLFRTVKNTQERYLVLSTQNSKKRIIGEIKKLETDFLPTDNIVS